MINTLLRLRPQICGEKKSFEENYSLKINSSGLTIEYGQINRQKTYHYVDQAFDQDESNIQIFWKIRENLLIDIHKYDALTMVFTGQSCSGKTTTMFGNGRMPGISSLLLKEMLDLSQIEIQIYEMLGNGNMCELPIKQKANRIIISSQNQFDITINSILKYKSKEENRKTHVFLQIYYMVDNKQKKISLIELAAPDIYPNDPNSNSRYNIYHIRSNDEFELNRVLYAFNDCLRSFHKRSNQIPFRLNKFTSVFYFKIQNYKEMRDSFLPNRKIFLFGHISGSYYCKERTIYTLRQLEKYSSKNPLTSTSCMNEESPDRITDITNTSNISNGRVYHQNEFDSFYNGQIHQRNNSYFRSDQKDFRDNDINQQRIRITSIQPVSSFQCQELLTKNIPMISLNEKIQKNFNNETQYNNQRVYSRISERRNAQKYASQNEIQYKRQLKEKWQEQMNAKLEYMAEQMILLNQKFKNFGGANKKAQNVNQLHQRYILKIIEMKRFLESYQFQKHFVKNCLIEDGEENLLFNL